MPLWLVLIHLMLSSIQFKKVCMHSIQPLRGFLSVAFKYSSSTGLSDDGSFSAFQGTLSSPSFSCASLHQAVNDVMILALRTHITSQAPQHFRSSKTQTICDSCSLSQEVTAVPAYTKRVRITNPLKLEKGGGSFKSTIKEHTRLTSNKQDDSAETNKKSTPSRKLSHHTSQTSPTGQAAFDIPPDIYIQNSPPKQHVVHSCSLTAFTTWWVTGARNKNVQQFKKKSHHKLYLNKIACAASQPKIWKKRTTASIVK